MASLDLGARRARELAGWEELEALLARLEKRGERALSFAEMERLGALYRHAAAQLAEAREDTQPRAGRRLSTPSAASETRGGSQGPRDPARARYLDALVRRAHFSIYAPPKRGLRPLWSLIMGGFAETFRATLRLQIVAAVLFAAGALAGYFATLGHVEVAYPILGLMFPAELVQGLIESDELRREYITSGRTMGAGLRSAFAAMLAFNNARVAIASFSLGIAGALPTVLIQVFNGAVLGSMAALYANRGATTIDFWAWVLPHGIPEVLALSISCAAGLSLGLALIDPRGRPRKEALAEAGRRAAILMGMALLLLLYAAAIEGWFRQVSLGAAPRFALAIFNFVMLALYLAIAGAKARGSAPEFLRPQILPRTK